ncbi:MAG: AI-2E family transporter [Paracoccaceae bacterium]
MSKTQKDTAPMQLSAQQKTRYWLIGLAVGVAMLWLLGNAILPFLVATAIAYFLEPVVQRLQRWGTNRLWAVILISLLSLLVVVTIFLLVVPLLIQQATALFSVAPDYIARLTAFLGERFPALFEPESPLRKAMTGLQSVLKDFGVAVVNQVLNSSLAFVDFLLLVFVVPVVTFYLMLDWPRVLEAIDKWLPREQAGTMRLLAGQIDKVLAGFVRGQLTVCVILGSFYALALAAIGLQFGVVIGIFAGLVSFIPFVGSLMGGILSIGLALYQFWGEPVWILVVAAVFLIGQLVEGNVLTPKLVGGSVGLHPVWLLFSLSAFGALFGFAGLLVAVPVAASIGVLGRYALSQYLQGRFYRGNDQDDA